jgi:hypothetical protein
MDRVDVSFWLGIAGFATSTVLAIIKGVEFFGARRVAFTTDTRFTGSYEIGNTIVLLNKSNVPAIISYYELAWTERRSFAGLPIPFTRKTVQTQSPLDPMDGCHQMVAPHAAYALTFNEDHHFDWGVGLKHDVYLKLWLVGRGRPIWLWITGPSYRLKLK